MYNYDNLGNSPAMTRTQEMGLQKVSYKEQIQTNLNFHKSQVEKCEKMLSLLERNPDIAEFMELSRI